MASLKLIDRLKDHIYFSTSYLGVLPGSPRKSVYNGFFPSYPRSLKVSEIAFTLASIERYPREPGDIETKWYTLNKMTSKYNQQCFFVEFLLSQKKVSIERY